MILSRETRRLSVVMPTWVGDVVMATPLLRVLREHLPDAEISAAMRPGMSSLLEGLDDIQQILEIKPGGLLGPARAGRVIRQTQPESVVLLPNSIRSALVARFSGAKQRIGFRRQGRTALLTNAIDQPSLPGIHTTLEDYLALAEAVTGLPRGEDNKPRLVVTDMDRKAAAGVMDLDAGNFAVLVPGANRADKRWPAASFAQLADILTHEHGLRVVATGSPVERSLLHEITMKATCPIIDLAKSAPGLGGLKAVMAAASLVITNDTGPRHIAAAVGTPIVSLFGPTDHRWTVLPGTNERRLLADPFLPESMIANRSPGTCRIDRITLEDVHAVAARLLDDAHAPSSPGPLAG